ncbi:MAG: hypothetical protein AAFY99_14685 [Pseudomonadota bacterium]
MGELVLPEAAATLVTRNKVTPDDVLRLRREVFRDGVATRVEAEALFAIDSACSDRCDEWDVFFIEAVTDYLINLEPPQGYVSPENAQWLMRAISKDGVVDTRTEIELLINVLERAKHSPAVLSAFALKQVAEVVVRGKGALAKNRIARAGMVTKADVDMLRRVLYAFGGGGQAMVTREEAEVLFDINDATVEADNDPAWSDLFTKAIGFSLLAAFGYVQPTRDEALAREEWLNDTDIDVGGFFGRVFAGGLRGFTEKVFSDTRTETAFAERNARFEAENRVAENICGNEAQWLVERIGRDGVLHDNERALLQFIAREARDIHPSLRPLLDKVA